jgi:hypothetical protein
VRILELLPKVSSKHAQIVSFPIAPSTRAESPTNPMLCHLATRAHCTIAAVSENAGKSHFAPFISIVVGTKTPDPVQARILSAFRRLARAILLMMSFG